MGARILVADDSATIQKVVEFTLSREDVELVQARSGDEAIQKARQAKPDLILIDHSMPGQSGQELCGAFRRDPQLGNVPIILMTAVSGNVDEAAARQAGATDIVSKPFESQILIGKVKQLLLGAPAAVAGEAAAPSPVQEEEVGVEAGESAFVVQSEEEMMTEEIRIPAGLTAEEAPLEIVREGSSEESIPTYDLSSTEEIELSMEPATHEDISPASEPELAIEDMAAAVGMGTPSMRPVEEKPAEPVPSPQRVQEPSPASVGPVTVPPDMVETLARQVSERVAAHIVQELRADLLQRIERLLWEVVPDLAEQLLTQEIQRIRDLVEGRK